MTNTSQGSARWFRNIGSLLTRQLLAQLLALAVFPFVVRVLGPDMYGKWIYAQTAVGFFAYIANPGLTTYGLQKIASEKEKAAEYIPSIRAMMLIFAALGYVILLGTVFFSSADKVSMALMLIFGLTFIVNAIFGLEWILNGLQRFDVSAILALISQSVFAGGVFIFLRSRNSVLLLPVLTIAGSACAGIMGWRWLRKEGISLSFSGNLNRGGKILKIGLFYGFASLMAMIYNKSDHLILSWLKGDSVLGQYAASYKLMAASMSIVLLGISVFVPYAANIAATAPERFSAALKKGLLILVSISIPMSIGGFMLSADIAALVLGPSFQDAGKIFRYLAVNIPFGVFASFFAGALLYAPGHYRRYTLVVSVAAFVNVLLNFLFIPLMGGIGAAITTIIAQATVTFAACYMGRRYLLNVFTSSLFHPFFASAAMVVVLIALSAFSLHVIVRITIGITAYILALWLIDRLRGREISSILTKR